MMSRSADDLRQTAKTNGREEIDRKSGISWIVSREQAFKVHLQSPVNNNIIYIKALKLKSWSRLYAITCSGMMVKS